jgi:hypothetical protein
MVGVFRRPQQRRHFLQARRLRERDRVSPAIKKSAVVDEGNARLQHGAAPPESLCGRGGRIAARRLAIFQPLNVFPGIASLLRPASHGLRAHLAAARVRVQGRPCHAEGIRRLLRRQVVRARRHLD